MRLDHLLSKETSTDETSCCNVLRSDLECWMDVTLFNLEGTRSEEAAKDGPIAQLARAHD